MSKIDAVTAAKAAETEQAQAFYAEAKNLADAGKVLREKIASTEFEFAGPAKIADEALRELDGIVRPSRKERVAARRGRQADASA